MAPGYFPPNFVAVLLYYDANDRYANFRASCMYKHILYVYSM